MTNFWKTIKRPIFCLAPMADVTDCAFRQIIAKYGKPMVFWTEFVSADGLAHPIAREKLLIDLKFGENEHPIVAQIFGSNIDNIREASKLCKELGFDGIDINMGCPDKSIEKQGAGAAMIKNPAHAREIIRAVLEGGGGLPVSVKTRIGYNRNEMETWLPEILKENISALTVHLRTRKEMSLVPAHWDLMQRIVEIRNEINKDVVLIGNGDVLNLEDGENKIKETGCDGVMLGRAIFGNPWLFAKKEKVLESEKLKVLVEHTKLFEEMLGKYKNFAIMKKHYKAYVNGWEGAKELRMKLMEKNNASEVENIINEFLK
jgi:nifR3 family TIM-barrel protein